MADAEMVAAVEPDAEVALAAIGAGMSYLTRRTRADADPPPDDGGMTPWLGLLRGGLAGVVIGVWGVFGFDDSLAQMLGGASGAVGLSVVATAVLAGAAVASLQAPPRTPLAPAPIGGGPRPLAPGVWSVEVTAPELGPGVARRMVVLSVGDQLVLWGLVPYREGLLDGLPAPPTGVVVRCPADAAYLGAWTAAVEGLGVVEAAEVEGLRVAALPDGPLGPELLALHEASGVLLVGALALHVPGQAVTDRAWAMRWSLSASVDRLMAPFAWRLRRPVSEALRAALRPTATWPVQLVAPAYGAVVDDGQPAWRDLLRSLGVG